VWLAGWLAGWAVYLRLDFLPFLFAERVAVSAAALPTTATASLLPTRTRATCATTAARRAVLLSLAKALVVFIERVSLLVLRLVLLGELVGREDILLRSARIACTKRLCCQRYPMFVPSLYW
jgi:hypothetical protein